MNNIILSTNNISSTETLKENIQKWVVIDTQMKLVNEKVKRMRDIKHKLSENICDYMIHNKLENKKISITDGELKIYEKTDYSPLTFTYIERTLAEIIPDKQHVEYIIQHLKDKRDITKTKDIRRTQHTNTDKIKN